MSTTTHQEAESSTRRASTRSARASIRRDKPLSPDGMFTVEDWAALPNLKPRYELIGGKLVQKTTATFKHAFTKGELLFSLTRWGDDRGWIFLPEGVGIKLGNNDGAVADITGFQPGIELQPDATYFSQVPFLIVEVVSRSTAKRDRTDKKIGYASIGVQIYLIADPDKKTLEVHTLKNGKYGSPQILKDNDVWQPAEVSEMRLEVTRLWLESTKV
ncbi:MAG TPA: Uma2 family endonuclease [Abditibacteriaceae bacterium]|nr:Uma2 family endonuclease [Abditibacteriaceae bacterium]